MAAVLLRRPIARACCGGGGRKREAPPELASNGKFAQVRFLSLRTLGPVVTLALSTKSASEAALEGLRVPDSAAVRMQHAYGAPSSAGSHQQHYYGHGAASHAASAAYGAPHGYTGSGRGDSGYVGGSGQYAAAGPPPLSQEGPRGPAHSHMSGSHASQHEYAAYSGEQRHGRAFSGQQHHGSGYSGEQRYDSAYSGDHRSGDVWPLVGVAPPAQAPPRPEGHAGPPPAAALSGTQVFDVHAGGAQPWAPPRGAAHSGSNGFDPAAHAPRAGGTGPVAPAALSGTQLFDVHAGSVQSSEPRGAGGAGNTGAAAFDTTSSAHRPGSTGPVQASVLSGTQVFDVHSRSSGLGGRRGTDSAYEPPSAAVAAAAARAGVDPFAPAAATSHIHDRHAAAEAPQPPGGDAAYRAPSPRAQTLVQDASASNGGATGGGTADWGATQLFDVHADAMRSMGSGQPTS